MYVRLGADPSTISELPILGPISWDLVRLPLPADGGVGGSLVPPADITGGAGTPASGGLTADQYVQLMLAQAGAPPKPAGQASAFDPKMIAFIVGGALVLFLVIKRR